MEFEQGKDPSKTGVLGLTRRAKIFLGFRVLAEEFVLGVTTTLPPLEKIVRLSNGKEKFHRDPFQSERQAITNCWAFANAGRLYPFAKRPIRTRFRSR